MQYLKKLRIGLTAALLSLFMISAPVVLTGLAVPNLAVAQTANECVHPAWSASQVYVADDQVSHEGNEYRAKWWTQGEEPGTTGEFGVWELLGPCSGDGGSGDDGGSGGTDPGACVHPAWDADTVYTGGDQVSHEGNEYRAKWWTQGEEPGATGGTGVWELLGPCSDDGGDSGGGDPDDTTPPATPSGLSATTLSSSRIALDWTDGSESDLAGYNVHRATSSGFTLSADNRVATDLTNSAFTDSGLLAETTYFYRVVALDNSGNESSPSTEVSATTTAVSDGPDQGFNRVGYFIQWGIYARNFFVKNLVTSDTAEKLTHINYAFIKLDQDLVCESGDPFADYTKAFSADESVDGVADSFVDQDLRGNFNQLRKLKEMHPGLKVYASIGGWTWSADFSDAALTEASRQNFVQSCVDMLLRGNLPSADGAGGEGAAAGVFDGIDIDWEWPASSGKAGNIIRAEDRENFTLLLQEFRSQMDALEAEMGRTFDLTAFLPASPSKVEVGFEVPEVMNLLTFGTLQGYDFHGSWETQTNHQSAIFQPANSPVPTSEEFTIDKAINAWVSRGASAEQLMLGIPFYGRGWTDVPDVNNGLFQDGPRAAQASFEAGTDDYKVLKGLLNQGFTLHRDDAAGHAWIFDGNTFWTFDDPALIERKMQFLRDNGLGGAMIWSLDGDTPSGELMQAIDQGLQN